MFKTCHTMHPSEALTCAKGFGVVLATLVFVQLDSVHFVRQHYCGSRLGPMLISLLVPTHSSVATFSSVFGSSFSYIDLPWC